MAGSELATPHTLDEQQDPTLGVSERQLIERERSHRRRESGVIVGSVIAIFCAGILAWQYLGPRMFGIENVSSPSLVFDRGKEWLADGYLLSNLGVTLQEAAIGFVLGAVVGVALGILFGVTPIIGKIASPFVSAFYAIPKVVLAPLLVIWLGIDSQLKIGLAFVFVVFLVVYNTWSGIQNVNKDLTDALRLTGASQAAVIRIVILPATFSWVLTGLRVSFPLALIGALLGELLASSNGIGHIVITAGDNFDITGMLVAVIALTIVAVLIDQVLQYAERVAQGYGLVGEV